MEFNVDITIPEDIIFLHILPKLSAKSLVKIQWVCKSWKRYIETNDFIQLHLRRTLQKPESHSSILLAPPEGCPVYIVNDLEMTLTPVLLPATKLPLRDKSRGHSISSTLVTSCNGLLLLRVSIHYFLWNPLKPEAFRELRFDHIKPNSNWSINCFGYDEYSDEYKFILQECNIWPRSLESESFVYCLGTDSWKSIPRPKFDFLRCTRLHNSLHSLHGVLTSRTTNIDVFDLRNEVCGQISLPDYQSDELTVVTSVLNLSVYKGLLSVINCEYTPNDSTNFRRYVFWVMKEYGVKESWTKLFELRNNCDIVRHIIFSERRLRVALVGSQSKESPGARFCDGHDDIKVEVTLIQDKMLYDCATEFFCSLVSVEDICKKQCKSDSGIIANDLSLISRTNSHFLY